VALRDVEDDRPRLKQGKVAIFEGRSLAEVSARQVIGLLQCRERHEPHIVWLPYLLERPTHAGFARQALPPSGDFSNAVIVAAIALLLANATIHRSQQLCE
jgi:hypothetical protein